MGEVYRARDTKLNRRRDQGRLVAYGVRPPEGRINLFLTRFPSGSGQWLLAEGATRPRFSADGKEVFYLTGVQDERGQPTGRLWELGVGGWELMQGPRASPLQQFAAALYRFGTHVERLRSLNLHQVAR
jgi:hypothetical protein